MKSRPICSDFWTPKAQLVISAESLIDLLRSICVFGKLPYNRPSGSFVEPARMSVLPTNRQLGGSIRRDSHLRPVYQIRVGLVEASAYRLYRHRFGTCEMYWLSVDSTERQVAEDWPAYCERSRTEVLDRFQQIVARTDFARTDFVQEALRWPVLKSENGTRFDIIPTLVFLQFSNSRPNFELTGARTPPSTPMGWRSSALIILSRVLSSDRHRLC